MKTYTNEVLIVEQPIAWIDDIHMLTVNFDACALNVHEMNLPVVYWKDKDQSIPITGKQLVNDQTVHFFYEKELPLGETLFLQWKELEIPIYAGKIVRTPWFEKHYTAPDAQLGAICSKHSTTFTVWAPTATKVQVIINTTKYPMNRKEKGIWTITIPGDWHGYMYEFEVAVNGKVHQVIDPYAKSSLANTKSGVIVDFSRTFRKIENRPFKGNLQDAIIYELSVRDATINNDSGITNKGKFLGLTEKNTKTKNGYSTGLDYLIELGVTHVELLPINDFARVDELNPKMNYNWGYDPLLYQVPEGSYATCTNDPIKRIDECKRMIHAFHEVGIAIIIDVVFNHVFIKETIEETNFEKLVPGYYFRFHENGMLANSSGCGNDFASERIMARKFILDTVDFWLTEYKVDGFRFDLMGILDIDTMIEIRNRCLQEKTPIMLLGEGWDMPTPLSPEKKATMNNSHNLKGIRFFNDYFRDTLKGGLFNAFERGYANGYGTFFERLPALISGCCLEKFGNPVVSEPTQTVNYVECHDNHTLWDRLALTNNDEPAHIRKKMHQIATGITILAQGVPFIHGGQEWFRTKSGVENSYNAGDHINELNWLKREEELANIEYVKALIKLRKNYKHFRLQTKEDILWCLYILNTPPPIFGYILLGNEEDFVIYINPTNQKHQIHLPTSSRWQIMVSNQMEIYNERYFDGEFMEIHSFEFIVLLKPVII